jgi:glycosyltransferase involved in cell wall biosynthesis
MKAASDLKVAIVADWLYGGGAERVVYELHKMFPAAPIYSSYCSAEWRAKLDDKVVTGWLQPLGRIRKFLPVLRIWWFTHLKLKDFDLVISSSGNGEAKGIKVPSSTTHICYCHTPTHFYWRHYDKYYKNPGFGLLNPVARFGLKVLVGPLRRWDYKAAQRPNYFIANSTYVQSEIKGYYGRDSIVIYPPVDVERFSNSQLLTSNRRAGFVTTGRQVPYKRIDIIVQACNRFKLPLKVIGRGPEHERLVAMAGPSVEFLGDVSDAEMPEQLAGAEAFLFAAFEDFGVAPVEALAAGTPVIAYKAGGALDYIKDGQNGLFFEAQTKDNLAAALVRFQKTRFEHQAIKASAGQFSAENFRQEIQEFIASILASKS